MKEQRQILITGSEGFIGKNLRAFFKEIPEYSLMLFDKEQSPRQLYDYIKRADFIIHLAGVNRPERLEEFGTGNAGLTAEIVGAAAAGGKVPVLMTSSVQAAEDNPYGKSKAEAEKALMAYREETGAPVYIYRLPGVFGKWCRPDYNSVVATFCHRIVSGLPIEISDRDREIPLIYIDDVIAEIAACLHGRRQPGFCPVPGISHVTLGGLADRIYAFQHSRKTQELPDLSGLFDRRLYATWLSYLPEGGFSYSLTMKRDQRGWLAEFIKTPGAGQIFVSRTKPGIVRGNHWHHTKVEKFLVLEGEGLITFRHILDDRVIRYPVSGERLTVVDIPPGYTHALENTGKTDLITLFWAAEKFNPDAPDTIYEEVKP